MMKNIKYLIIGMFATSLITACSDESNKSDKEDAITACDCIELHGKSRVAENTEKFEEEHKRELEVCDQMQKERQKEFEAITDEEKQKQLIDKWMKEAENCDYKHESKSTNEVEPTNSGKKQLTSLKFEETEYDFGTITQGEKVEHSFVLTNTGKINLIIEDAKATCGCTVPSFPKEPIAPGEKAKIDVVFDSEGKIGEMRKSVTVTANTHPHKNIVYLVGVVEE